MRIATAQLLAQGHSIAVPIERIGPVLNDFNPFGALIPYRNLKALAAYYLGVFSMIPLFGLLCAIPAVALGLDGIRLAQRRPEVQGVKHAWTGTLLGAFLGTANLVFLAYWLWLLAV